MGQEGPQMIDRKSDSVKTGLLSRFLFKCHLNKKEIFNLLCGKETG